MCDHTYIIYIHTYCTVVRLLLVFVSFSSFLLLSNKSRGPSFNNRVLDIAGGTFNILATYLKKNLNAPRPSEHPPVRGEN